MERRSGMDGGQAAQTPRRAWGLTLVELLVSLALGSLLLAGGLQVLAGMRQTERSQDAVARMQEAGRFALNFLAQEIRGAGYQGCRSRGRVAQRGLNDAPPSFRPERAVQGWEAEGSAPGEVTQFPPGAAPVSTAAGGWSSSGGNILEAGSVLPGTDIIRLWGVQQDEEGEGLISGLAQGSPPLLHSTLPSPIAVGDVLLLSDCRQAIWVQACALSSGGPPGLGIHLSTECSPGNRPGLDLDVAPGGSIHRLSGTQFHIGRRGDLARNPPALFRRRLNEKLLLDSPEELVEGIADLQLLYGENRDGDPFGSADAWLPADEVADWDAVVAVHISLLVQSLEDGLVPQSLPYAFNGVSHDGGAGNGTLPPDQRLRSVFSSTVALRNRLP